LTRNWSLLTVTWVRWPGGDENVAEPTPAWPLEAVLDAAAGAGFEAVGLDHYTIGGYVRHGGSVDEIGVLLRARGLRCTDVGVLPIGLGCATAAAGDLARVATITGAPVCIAALYANVAVDDAVRELRAAADLLDDAGVRIAFEFTAYGHPRSLLDAIELCRAVGWERCGLLVDSWHVFRGGEPLTALRSLDAEQIALVHVNDAAPSSGPDPVLLDPVFEGRFRRTLPGAGTFPLDAFAEALAATGYGGTISIEVLSTELRRLPPQVGARQLLQSLRESFAAA
jgi:sugar phosphate isomerase/epimerase